MKRLLVTAAAVVAVVGLMAPAHATGTAGSATEGPYGPIAFQDYGSCTNIWSDINLKTTYVVNTKSHGGIFQVEVKLAGKFTSIAGQSPGACDSGTDNGNTVTDGVKGKMKQSLFIEVASTKFNPKGTCDDACATDYTFTGINTFVGNFFKSGATWAFSATKLAHEIVTSSDKSLCEDKWVLDYDPMTGEVSNAKGDIATSCSS